MCSPKKQDESLTYAGSGLRGAYAEHTFFTFVNIYKKGVSAPPIRLRGLRRMTQKKMCNPYLCLTPCTNNTFVTTQKQYEIKY